MTDGTENTFLAEIPDDEIAHYLTHHGAFSLLNPKEQQIVHLFVSGNYTIPQIGHIVGHTSNYVRQTLGRKHVQEATQELQENETRVVLQGVLALRLKALETMNELLNSPDDGVRFKAAQDTLNRVGIKAVEKKEVQHTFSFEQKLMDSLQGSEYLKDVTGT